LPRKAKMLLYDVRTALDDVADFLTDVSSEQFAADKLVKAAVERNFEIVGEALNTLSRVAPELANQIPELASIIGFRNILIHGYAKVDPSRVYRIAKEQAPLIRTVAADMLDNLEKSE